MIPHTTITTTTWQMASAVQDVTGLLGKLQTVGSNNHLSRFNTRFPSKCFLYRAETHAGTPPDWGNSAEPPLMACISILACLNSILKPLLIGAQSNSKTQRSKAREIGGGIRLESRCFTQNWFRSKTSSFFSTAPATSTQPASFILT